MLDKEKLQQPFTNVLSWILTELQENQEDFISIVCKEGKEFRTSGLLLAAVSPFISNLLKSIKDFQDCTIFLPDVEISCIEVIFDRVFSFASTQDEQSNNYWSRDPFASLFSFKSDQPLPGEWSKDPNDIKEENDFDDTMIPDTFCDTQDNDVGEDNINTVCNGIPINKVLIRECRVDLERIVVPSDLISYKTYSPINPERIRKAYKTRKIKMKIKETRDKNIMKKIKTKLKSLNKVSDMNSSSDEKLSFHSPETNTDNQPVPKRNRRKNVRNDSDFKLENSNNSEKEGEENKIEEKRRKVINVKLEDLPTDEIFVEYQEKIKQYCEEKEEEENKRDEKRRKVIYLKPDELPTDEKFVEYQEKIKQYCEDDCIDMTPENYWLQIHGLTINDKIEKIYDVLVCPLCLYHTQELRYYFSHLQVHKLKIFKCQCMPSSSPENMTEKLRGMADQLIKISKGSNGSWSEEFKTAVVDLLGNGFSYKEIARQLGVKQRRIKWLLKNHIKEIKDKRDLTRAKVAKCAKLKKMHVIKDHWKWIKCDKCQDYIDPLKMRMHLAFKHKIKQLVETKCEICDEKFKVGTSNFSFLLHMSRHKAEKFTCDCEIKFISLRHKNHHMQSVHLKEFVCCDQCNDVFKNMKSLETHKKEHSEIFKLNQKVVCDQCGKELGSPQILRIHLETVHSVTTTRLAQCEKCARQMNPLKLKHHVCGKKSIKKICKYCGKEVYHMAKHIRTKHLTHLLKFRCHQCEKGFDEKRNLQQHEMNVHLKLRPYSCRYGCEFAYNDLSNRNHHERKKHGGLYIAAQNKRRSQ